MHTRASLLLAAIASASFYHLVEDARPPFFPDFINDEYNRAGVANKLATYDYSYHLFVSHACMLLMMK